MPDRVGSWKREERMALRFKKVKQKVEMELHEYES